MRIKDVVTEDSKRKARKARQTRGKASKALCTSSKPDSQLGASQLASCKSQGLRARTGDKPYKNASGKSVSSKDKKVKGKEYGGPLPDYS